MSENKIDCFNTEPLITEIENVIKKGLKQLLNDYMSRYQLLENTHKKIMLLPSVMNELNKHNIVSEDDENDNDDIEEETMFFSIQNMTHELVKQEVGYIDQKIEKIDKNYNSILENLNKVLTNIQELNVDIQMLKETPVKDKNIDTSKVISNATPVTQVIKLSIVSACENENIKFDIKEEENIGLNKDAEELVEKDVSDEDSSDEDEEEVEEDEEEVEEEEDEEEVEEEEEDDKSEEDDKQEQVDEVETVEEEDEEDDKQEQVDEVETVEEEQAEVEEELFEIEIDDVTYCTDNEENGFIYKLTEDGDVGDKLGYLKDGEPFFYDEEN